MGSFETLDLIVFALYLIGTICIFAGTLGNRSTLKRLGYATAVAGFSLHSLDILLVLFFRTSSALYQGAFYFALLSWSFLFVYFVLWYRLKITFLGLTAAPLALILFSASYAYSGLEVIIPPHLSALLSSLHVGSLYLSTGFLAMAFGAGIAFLYMERKIKTKTKLAGFQKEMPSLSTFDRVNAIAVTCGFPLYTFGIVTGYIWSGIARGQVFSYHPRELAALISWLLFALLFHQRFALGWKGRKPARIAIWVFVFTIVSMLGINYLFPVHHSLIPTN